MRAFTLISILLAFSLKAHAQSPAISNFTPTSGVPGITVTITGTNFDALAENNKVLFGTVKATVTSASTTQLTVIVPIGTLHQSISILNIITGLTGMSNKKFLPIFSGCGNLTLSSFALKKEILNGQSSTAITTSDIDGDAKSDIVMSGFNYFYIHRNISVPGAPAFSEAYNYAMNANFTGIAAGDLTGDGKPELVTTNPLTNKLVIRKNSSTPGSFSFGSILEFDASAKSDNNASIGDIDGDGKNDVVILSTAPAVSIFRNTTSGGVITFAPVVSFPLGGLTNVHNTSLGDFDGDGKLDIAVDGNSLFIFRNLSTPGSISFSALQIFTTASNCSGLSTTDVDGDGKADISVVNQTTNNFSIFRNTSTPGVISLAARIDYLTSSYPNNISTGDIDGDGKADLVILPQDPGQFFSAFKNLSTPGSIALATRIDYNASSANRAGLLGDFDEDKQPDIVVITNSSNLAVFKNIASCIPPNITSFTPAAGPLTTMVTITGTNFNTNPANNVVFFGSSRATVVTATATQLTVTVPSGASRSQISVTDITTHLTAYSANVFQPTFPCGASISASSFSPRTTLSSGSNYIVLKDIDGDGKADLSLSKSNSTINIYRNSSTNTVVLDAPVTLTLPSAGGPVFSEDINGDGKPDLITSASNNLSYYKNASSSGNISFEPRVDLYVGNNLLKNLYDFDGDGKADAVTSDNFYNDKLRILKNTSSEDVISFMEVLSLPFATSTIVVTDMDGDGKPDILIPQQPNVISFLKNTSSNGTISFAAKVDFTTNIQPILFITGDVDSDGKPDVLYAQTNIGKISILRNTTSSGILSFAPVVDVQTGNYPRGILVADLDGDRKPEVSVSAGNNKVLVMKNNSSPVSISLAAYVSFDLDSSPIELFGVDLNADGKAEVISQNSSTVSILQNTSPYSVTGGVITTNQTICLSGDPAAFTQTTASTGPGALSYQWQSSTDNIIFNNISGVTTITYNAPAGVTQTTYYKRLTYSAQDSLSCNASSNTLTVTVSPVSGGTIAGNQTVCSGGDPAAFTQTVAAAGPGTLSYQWQRSTNGSTFSNISGATSLTYNVPAGITQTTYYKRIVTSNLGCMSESNTLMVTIDASPVPTISSIGCMCEQYVTLIASSGGTNYVWSNGYTGQTVNMLASGSYSVTVTYPGGCSKQSGNLFITIPSCSPDPCDSSPPEARKGRNIDMEQELIATSTTVYPNPADEKLYVHLPEPTEKNILIKLYSPYGFEVGSTIIVKGKNKVEFDTKLLEKGMYTVLLQNSKGQTIFTRRFLITHP